MKLTSALSQTASTLSEIWLIKAIRRGLMYAMPLILIGSIILVILNFPVTAFQNFMVETFTTDWKAPFLLIYQGTFGIISVCVLMSITYAILCENHAINSDGVPYIVVMITTLGCFFIFSGTSEIVLPSSSAQATGLFRAILISVGATYLYIFFSKHRLFKLKLYSDYSDFILSQTLHGIEPAFLTLAVAATLKFTFAKLGWHGVSFDRLIDLMSSTYGLIAAILFDLISHIMWFFGIHGNNILEPVNLNVFSVASDINTDLVLKGLPTTEIFTKQFFDVFVFLGGSGATLGLIAALILKGKKSNTYRLATFSVLPGIFNINELAIFGLPIVLNPYFLVPFLLTPVVLTLTSYFAMALGLVPYTQNAEVVWTSPIIIGGYVATGGSLAGSALQIINLGLSTAIYLPFVTLYEKHKIEINKKVLSRLISEIFGESAYPDVNFINRTDEVGSMARTLVRDIRTALHEGVNPLYLEFQPKISKNEKVVGGEALLRWSHAVYGRIPPPVIVKLAEEAEMGDDLGYFIIKECFVKFNKWRSRGLPDFLLSINLSPQQVKNKKLVSVIRNELKQNKIPPGLIEFELTESAALDQTDVTKNMIMDIRRMGCRIAIDDFGMGHSSLMYIKKFHIDTVKLDGSLVQDILTDVNSQEIVVSICNLCDMLNLEVIAEYVETIEQRDKLLELGCRQYQGYLYSPALSEEDFVNYVNNLGTEKIISSNFEQVQFFDESIKLLSTET